MNKTASKTLVGLACVVCAGLASADFRFSGRVDLDAGAARQDVGTNFETSLRRLRLSLSGELDEQFRYFVQSDFSDGGSSPQAMWLRYRPDNNHEFYAGRLEIPNSLAGVSSSLYNPMMERPLPVLVTSRYTTGAAYHYFKNGFNVRLSYLQNDFNNFGSNREFGKALGVRAGKRLHFDHVSLYLGGSYLNQDPDRNARLRSRQETSLFDTRVVDTRRISGTDHVEYYGLELLSQIGSWTIQSEYNRQRVSRNTGDDLSFDGAYLQLGRIFNGERRFNYKRGRWMRPEVEPWKTFELNLRLSEINLDDQDVRGGFLRSASLGANLYVSEKTRLMFNFSYPLETRGITAERSAGAIFQTRLQVSF